MKKIKVAIGFTIFLYTLFALLTVFFFRKVDTMDDMAYKVEMNEILTIIEQGNNPEELELELGHYDSIRHVRYLPMKEEAAIKDFFQNRNGYYSSVEPLFIQGKLKGYLCFDYILKSDTKSYLIYMETILLLAFLAILITLLYIKSKILTPFQTLSNMPYELSQGHLNEEILENKERYFGKFIWGVSMLRDTLKSSKNKELKLQKEKKLLLLSISHDIKIPLSAIKLYAKSLYEDILPDITQKLNAARKIEAHAKEIENFVKQIVEASSEDIVSIEVRDGEFYIQDYMNHILNTYAEKFGMNRTDFIMKEYDNRLLKGDLDRAVEVMDNLLENALKYGDGKRVVIDFYEEDYCQVITIYNSGISVEDREFAHLFDSFFRGINSKAKEGNGLGLYICKQIMQKMDGEIFVERTEDGMRFCLVFRQ